VNDRAVAVFEKYDFELSGTKKGRGMIIASTDKGIVALKEYNGSEEKLEWQEAFTNGLKKQGFTQVDGLFRDKEGNLTVTDYEGVRYIVKEYITGKECNVNDLCECKQAARQIARLHIAMRDMMREPLYIRRKKVILATENTEESKNEDVQESDKVQTPVVDYDYIRMDELENLKEMLNRNRPGFLQYESKKHKTELIRARQFIRKKSSKNDFELLFLKEFDRFLSQVEQSDAYLTENEYAFLENKVKEMKLYCHGDCNHHNILFSQGQVSIQNLERLRPDLQIKDLYLFIRKICEKNKWTPAFATACVDAYMEEMPLCREELKYLYTRFWYPEKFRKITNGYMNQSKALPPRRQKEKLQSLLGLEKDRMEFLNTFQKYYQI